MLVGGAGIEPATPAV